MNPNINWIEYIYKTFHEYMNAFMYEYIVSLYIDICIYIYIH